MFHVHLRKKWSLLSLDEMCCGYQLGPTGPMYYLKPVFPYFLSRWSVCWYEWGIKVPHYYCVTVQFSHSVVSDSFWPHGLQYARFPCLLPTGLLKLMSIKLVMPSSHFILCCPLLLLSSIFRSIRVFSNGLTLCIRQPKYWSFSISPSNEYLGLISFRIDWFDLLTAQETHKSLLQHHNWKASILWHSAFFMVQLSHLYMTTGKTIALTRWTFVRKLMSAF